MGSLMVCKLRLLLLAALLFCATAHAANRDVCSSCLYTTIAEGLSAAQSGDTVRVAGGIYAANTDIQKTNWQVRLEGGYNQDFSARDSESIIEGWLRVSVFNSGRAEIDGFTVRSSGTQGIVLQSETTDVAISNCKVYDNASFGIYAHASGDLQIHDNIVYQNGSYGGIAVWRMQTSGPASITGNTVYSHSCGSCHGIMLYQSTAEDLIYGNTVYGNEYGISVTSAAVDSAPDISFNKIYDNRSNGLNISRGAANVHHNTIYNNAGYGGYVYSSANMILLNNTFVGNEIAGFGFGQGSGKPYIRNNIFQGNHYGLTMGDVTSYAATSRIEPNSFMHNSFYANTYGQFIHLGQLPEMGFSSEIPGSWGDINRFSWSDNNMIQEALFVDAQNGDFRLSAGSFLIDEGADQDGYTSEPSPNGSRINIGAMGNTSSAESSPEAGQILSLSGLQSGNNIEVRLATSSAVSHYWIDLQYWDGEQYRPIAGSQLTSDDYAAGYKSGRVRSGGGKVLLWQDTNLIFAGQFFNSKLRATISHGNTLSSLESAPFLVDYPFTTLNPTATPSPTNTPAFSATPAATAQPSPTSTPASAAPTKAATPAGEKKKRPKFAPKIRALKGSYDPLSSIVDLPVDVQDKDSGQLNFQGQIRSGSKRVAAISASAEISGPRVTIRVNLELPKQGIYTYCLKAMDGDGNHSQQSCSKFRITSN